MKQQTLTGFEKYGKSTRRAQFLAEMERILPWLELTAAIEPVYPKGGGSSGGRPPVPLERLLRIYFLQLWFNLSDPAAEEALYDSAAMRSFVGIDLGREPAPDETTICKFRRLLERNGLGKVLLKATNQYLRENGMKIGNGTHRGCTGWKSPRRSQTCSWPERGCGVDWGRHSVCEIRWNRDFAAGAAEKSVLRTDARRLLAVAAMVMTGSSWSQLC